MVESELRESKMRAQVEQLTQMVRIKQEEADVAKHMALLEVQEEVTLLNVGLDMAKQENAVLRQEFRGLIDTIKFWEKELDDPR